MTKDEILALLNECLGVLSNQPDSGDAGSDTYEMRYKVMAAIERLSAEPKTPDPGKAARRVFQCIVGSGVLRDKSAKELVGLAIEHLRPSGDMGMLILHEMCSRVHPDWAKDEDSGT